MKIFMIGQKGMPAKFGGVERHVHELSVRLVKLGHKVTVYSRAWYIGADSANEVEGVKIKLLPSLHTKHLDTITHVFLATIDAIKNKADIIHYHGVGPTLLSWIPRLFAPKIKVIATFHSIDRKHKKWNWLAKFFLILGEWTACAFPHETIAVSRTIQQYIRDVYNKESLFIPNGVPSYERLTDTAELSKFGLQSGQYLLLVSRLIPHKGIHYAISAYQKIKTDWPLVIVGDSYYTDQYADELKHLADNNPKIIFTGFLPHEEIKQLYSHAKLLLHPSDNEGLPITVLEGMAFGLPILVSDIIEHQELIDNPEYNFVHGDTDSLTEKLSILINKNPAKLNAEGEKNRAVVKRVYHWDQIMGKFERVYGR